MLTANAKWYLCWAGVLATLVGGAAACLAFPLTLWPPALGFLTAPLASLLAKRGGLPLGPDLAGGIYGLCSMVLLFEVQDYARSTTHPTLAGLTGTYTSGAVVMFCVLVVLSIWIWRGGRAAL